MSAFVSVAPSPPPGTEPAPAAAPARVRTIGEYVPLVDGPDKVSGRARYTADLPAAAGALAGRILRSPWGHAAIRSIDTTEAEALPGVRAVVTGADCDRTFGVLPIAMHEYPLARDRVRYRGRGDRGRRGGRRCDRGARPRPHPGRGGGASRVLHGRGGDRPRRGRPPREAPRQRRARRRVRVGGRGRGPHRRRPRAREDLPLRGGLPGPDGDARGPRRLRPRARPAHRARKHPGPLLRAPHARALPRHGEVPHPGGESPTSGAASAAAPRPSTSRSSAPSSPAGRGERCAS